MLAPQLSIVFALLGLVSAIPLASSNELSKRAIPTPVSASTARVYLTQLTVTPQSNSPAYDRSLFPHWITSGGCNTRETVLKRDGRNVVVNSSTCSAESGTWFCEYTGNVYPQASDVDIDHMIPLSNAWKSGARDWTTSRRQDFANDLTRPQLIAVDDSTNQSKSDQGPEDWMPPRTAFHCIYIRSWVQVKHYYDLTVTQAEYNKIDSVLVGC